MSADLGGIGPTALEVARVLVVLAAGLLIPAGVAKLRRPVVRVTPWAGGRPGR